MLTKVSDYFAGQIHIKNPDEKVSIADLAQHVEFEANDAAIFQTSVACIAVDAITEEFYWEVVESHRDFYDGGKILFKDGSMLSFG